MINPNELENKIDQDFTDYLLYHKNLAELKKVYEKKLAILDEFFSLYVDKVALDPAIPYTEEWNLYNRKYKEYELYDGAINRINSYIKENI